MDLMEFDGPSVATLDLLRAKSMRLALAESCTGGLVCAALTGISGSSDVLDRGFVTYSNCAKVEMLGIDGALIERHGAVSEEVALAMAAGALLHSKADIGASVTGIAGPSGGSLEKAVGLVWFGVCLRGSEPVGVRREFGDLGRQNVRAGAVLEVLDLIRRAAVGDGRIGRD